MIHMSRRELISLCQGLDPASLPLPVRAAMAGARSTTPYIGREDDQHMQSHVHRLQETLGIHEIPQTTITAGNTEATTSMPQGILLRSSNNAGGAIRDQDIILSLHGDRGEAGSNLLNNSRKGDSTKTTATENQHNSYHQSPDCSANESVAECSRIRLAENQRRK